MRGANLTTKVCAPKKRRAGMMAWAPVRGERHLLLSPDHGAEGIYTEKRAPASRSVGLNPPHCDVTP